MNIKSVLYSLGAVLLWSTVATAFKLTLTGMHYSTLVFYSSLFSTIVLFIIGIKTNPREILEIFKGKKLKNNIALGLLNPFLYYMVLFKAYSLLPAQEAQPLNFSWPLVFGIMSAIFLKEKFTLRKAIGLIIAFSGAVVIATRGDIFSFKIHNPAGAACAFGSSVLWALFWILSLIDKREATVKLCASFLTGTVITGIYLLIDGSFATGGGRYLMGALYIGIFEMGITFFLWLKGLSLSRNRAATSTLAYLSPFLSIFFISAILGEKIAASSVIGLTLIVSAIIYQSLPALRNKGRVN